MKKYFTYFGLSKKCLVTYFSMLRRHFFDSPLSFKPFFILATKVDAISRLKRWFSPPVCIRPARVADVASLTKSHGLSWQVTYRGYMPDYALDNLPLNQWKQSWKAYIQEGKDVLVVAKGRFIMGFVNFGPSRDDDLDKTRIGELYGVYLHPDHWRHGYGRRMCEAAIDKLKEQGYSEVTLWVFKQNSPARRFYKRLGFTKMHGKRVQERYPGWIIEQTRYRMKL